MASLQQFRLLTSRYVSLTITHPITASVIGAFTLSTLNRFTLQLFKIMISVVVLETRSVTYLAHFETFSFDCLTICGDSCMFHVSICTVTLTATNQTALLTTHLAAN